LNNTNDSRNITIATFAAFGFYKQEAYEANLWAGKILAEHGVPVAYKSVSAPKILLEKLLSWNRITSKKRRMQSFFCKSFLAR
jgi:hypothetical protein